MAHVLEAPFLAVIGFNLLGSLRILLLQVECCCTVVGSSEAKDWVPEAYSRWTSFRSSRSCSYCYQTSKWNETWKAFLAEPFPWGNSKLQWILHLRKFPGSWFWVHSSLLAEPWNYRIVNVVNQFRFLYFQLKVLKITTISQLMLNLNV